jgi:hypothetical protein
MDCCFFFCHFASGVDICRVEDVEPEGIHQKLNVWYVW